MGFVWHFKTDIKTVPNRRYVRRGLLSLQCLHFGTARGKAPNDKLFLLSSRKKSETGEEMTV